MSGLFGVLNMGAGALRTNQRDLATTGHNIANAETPGYSRQTTLRRAREGAPGQSGGALLLARAVGEEQNASVGRQAGGRVFLFLETDDFDGTYARMLAEGVAFRETPRSEPYGKVAVFEDLYGNAWDLLESRG